MFVVHAYSLINRTLPLRQFRDPWLLAVIDNIHLKRMKPCMLLHAVRAGVLSEKVQLNAGDVLRDRSQSCT
jgi:hypothetical protein